MDPNRKLLMQLLSEREQEAEKIAQAVVDGDGYLAEVEENIKQIAKLLNKGTDAELAAAVKRIKEEVPGAFPS
jgi:hypothetical protein